MKLLTPLILTFLIFVCNSTIAQKWELTLEKEGIKVYTRLLEGSNFKEFKGEIEIDALAEEIANELMNVENYPNWSYKTTSIKMLKKEEDRVFYYYFSETPFVVRNREAYYCNQLKVDEKTKIISIYMNTFPSEEPIPKNFVRVPISNGTWTITPLSVTKSKVVFEMQADPGGIIPAWLANLVVVESPFVTLKNLRALVTKN